MNQTQATLFGRPNLGDLGPCNVYVGTAGLKIGSDEFKNKWVGKTSSTTIRPARFSYVDFTSSQDGAEPADRIISGQGANIESSIVTPSADILSLLIPGFVLEKDGMDNIKDAYLQKIIGEALSNYAQEVIAIRFRKGRESRDRRDMILFKEAWPSVETVEMVYDAATPREISSLIYEARPFPYTKADGEEIDVYWSFPPSERLDVTAPGEVTNFVITPGGRKLDLSWVNPQDEDFSSLQIAWMPGEGQHLINSKNTTSYAITGLDANQLYTVTIQTIDRAGNKSEGVTQTGTPT